MAKGVDDDWNFNISPTEQFTFIVAVPEDGKLMVYVVCEKP